MIKIKKRNRTIRSWIFSSLSIIGVALAFGFGYSMKPQETKSFYTTAEISADGSVDIVEIIDTDFTGKSQRGI